MRPLRSDPGGKASGYRAFAAEVAEGRSNAEVAARLFMSEATVKAHVSRVTAKLGAANRVQVAITVRDAGLA